MVAVLAAGVLGLWFQVNAQVRDEAFNPGLDYSYSIAAGSISRDLDQLSPRISKLEDAQTTSGITVVDNATVQSYITAIRIDVAAQHLPQARQELNQLAIQVTGWQKQLDGRITARTMEQKVAASKVSAITAPIIIYHDTPSDFEKQLQYLVAHGYTSIDLDQLAAALTGQGTLPAKPVLLTFDDGLASQMTAFDILKKYNFKATFYIIDGGPGSGYHIGANRHLPDPQGGNNYLTWDQIRQIDANPLMTIASHTVDHLNLAVQSPEIQRFEIFDGKRQLEDQLGHPVRHFAYPYGSYTATTIALVKEAGFVTATSTLPGTVHTPDTLFTLHRARVVYKLP